MKKLSLIIAIIALTSCAVNVKPTMCDGSKADGIVKLSYTRYYMNTPIIDWEEANKNAIARCKAWGYSDAETFGDIKSQCASSSGGDCMYKEDKILYQCTEEN